MIDYIVSLGNNFGFNINEHVALLLSMFIPLLIILSVVVSKVTLYYLLSINEIIKSLKSLNETILLQNKLLTYIAQNLNIIQIDAVKTDSSLQSIQDMLEVLVDQERKRY